MIQFIPNELFRLPFLNDKYNAYRPKVWNNVMKNKRAAQKRKRQIKAK